MSAWHFFWCSLAADDFTVCGYSFEKEKRFLLTNEIAEVVDPIHSGTQQAAIYSLENGGTIYRVAHKEWTPGVYLAFAESKTLPVCAPKFRWDPAHKWVRIDENKT